MLTLTSGDTSIVIAPERGASLIGWMRGRTPILRRALPQAVHDGDPHAMACFPLLPYCNRIGNARFTWQGVPYQLARNFGDHPHAIHGVGWQSAWTVIKAAPRTVGLALAHRPSAAWPFAFDATVTYSLSGSALTVAIGMTNRHATAAPAGIGLHPYFPKTPDAALRFNADGAWRNGDDALPYCHGPLPPEWQHAAPRLVTHSRLDNCFTGWDQISGITAASTSLRVQATDVFRQLQVFTPYWADFFCVEPVSHVPDAINRDALPADQAMHVLQPNETLCGAIVLSPTD